MLFGVTRLIKPDSVKWTTLFLPSLCFYLFYYLLWKCKVWRTLKLQHHSVHLTAKLILSIGELMQQRIQYSLPQTKQP